MREHAAILIRDEDRFLFVRRSKGKKTLPNIWAFPSGTKEEGESLAETAIREAEEELGIYVDVEETLAVQELPEFGVRLHFLVCGILSGEPIIKDYNEIEEMEWLTFENFFDKYEDAQIGHGLIFLRKNNILWEKFCNKA